MPSRLWCSAGRWFPLELGAVPRGGEGLSERAHRLEDNAGRWWEGATLYLIYVRSWQDSDGDGYGDLKGACSRLDHLAWLGIDGIWLSPTAPSPDADWGYDVTDYTAVHPELGTLEDLDRLIAEAARRSIRVLLDLVPNHTSSAHPWFVEARSSRDSPRRDWYVWADPAPGGGPPNNWLDSTGQPAWTLDEPSGQYYLHNFLPEQPDLNWWNGGVHKQFDHILRFWLDRGVAGFRIDVAHGLYHDRELRDDPPAPLGPGARFGLQPAYSLNRPEVHAVYRSWRRLVERYRPVRLLLGETWVLDVERMATFYGDGDELQLCFNFCFVFAPFSAAGLRRVVADTFDALPPGACPVWTGSNHDVGRFASHWAGGDSARTRLGLVVLCTLPGTTVLCYGDELGLTDVPVTPAARKDAMTLQTDNGRFNRDEGRTPMPWEPGPNWGFSPAGVTPWLPLGDRDGMSVAEQLADRSSTLWLTRELLSLRRSELGGGIVDYEQLPSGDGQWLYRSGPLVVAANFTGEEALVDLPAGRGVLSSLGASSSRDGGPRAVLHPWEALIIKCETAPARRASSPA